MDDNGQPLAHFGSGLKITSEQKPTFKHEAKLAFPLPEGLPANPSDAYFYVLRRLDHPGGEAEFETLDYATVEGTGANAKVVTASPPFSGYSDSLGSFGAEGGSGLSESLVTFTFLMWMTSATKVDPATLLPSGDTIAHGALTIVSPVDIPSKTVVQARVTETSLYTTDEKASEEERTEDIVLSRAPKPALAPTVEGAGNRLYAELPIKPARVQGTSEVKAGTIHLDILAGREARAVVR